MPQKNAAQWQMANSKKECIYSRCYVCNVSMTGPSSSTTIASFGSLRQYVSQGRVIFVLVDMVYSNMPARSAHI